MAHTAKADADAISEVLRRNAGLHDGVRQMLLEGLPCTLPVQGEPRHGLQDHFAKLAQATILELKHAAAVKLESIQAAIQKISQEIEAAKESESAASKQLEAASAAVGEREKKLELRSKALEKTREEREKADYIRDAIFEECGQLEALKSEASFILAGPLELLVKGGWEDEDVRESAIGTVTKLLESMHAEQAIVAAAPKALALRPGDRVVFDKLTAASVVEILQQRVSSMDQRLQAKAGERDDAKVQALGLMALSDRESEEVMQAQVELMEAKATLQQATLALEEAGAETGRKGAELNTQLSAQVLEEERAKQIHDALEAAERFVELKYEAA